MSVTIKTYLDAVKQAITDHFGESVQTVDIYDPADTDPVNTPAVLLELEGCSEGDDSGDERTPLTCRLAAHCILSTQTADVEVEVWDFAAQLLVLLRGNLFALGGDLTRPAELEISPSVFQPELAGYEARALSWEQTLYLGDSVWSGEGVTPTEVYLGINPDIGTGNEPDYQDVTQGGSS